MGITCQQRSHSGHVSVVFSSLIGTPHDHVANAAGIQTFVAKQQFAEHMGGQVIGPNWGQCATKVSNGCANPVYEVGVHEADALVWVSRSRQKSKMGLKTKVCTKATSPLTTAYMRLPSWVMMLP